MKLAALFSGGKDSTYSILLAQRMGHNVECLLSMKSINPESYMFHTPSISSVEIQADVMGLPIILGTTRGEKESELKDLEGLIRKAKEEFDVEGIVTGALCSEYQEKRIGKICSQLGLACVNPLWRKDQLRVLQELIDEKFDVIITGVFAYPLTKEWLGRRIDKAFIRDAKALQEKHGINPAGEGGEFETLVLNCPLFKRPLRVKSKRISGSQNSFRMDVELE